MSNPSEPPAPDTPPVEQPAPLFDRSLKRGSAAVLGSGVVFGIIGAIVSSPRTGISVFVGSIVALANLVAFAWVVRAMLRAGGSGAVLFLVLKLFGLFAFVGFLLAADVVRALPFAFGYASLPLGLAIASFADQKASDR